MTGTQGGIGSEQLIHLRREVDKKYNEANRLRKSLVLAAERAHQSPQNERPERDRAEKSRRLKSLESELAELRERLVKSWSTQRN